MFPFLWVLELSTCLSHSNSQTNFQQLLCSWVKSKSKLYYNRRTISEPISLGVNEPIWDPRPIFSSSFNYLQTVAGLLIWGALSNERLGSVVYSCCWASPGPSPTALMTILSEICDSTNLYFSLQKQGSPVILPGIGFVSFIYLLLYNISIVMFRYNRLCPILVAQATMAV
jgi:hypothetical protein